MSQKKNPFAAYVPELSKVHDPNTITLEKLQNYHSVEHQKLDSLFRSLKKSRLYMAGIFGLFVAGAWYGEKQARNELFGSDNKGGSYLNLQTTRDEAHFAYNREFQRMFHLAETVVPDVSPHSSQYLTDLGVDLPRRGASNIPKRGGHEKYY